MMVITSYGFLKKVYPEIDRVYFRLDMEAEKKIQKMNHTQKKVLNYIDKHYRGYKEMTIFESIKNYIEAENDGMINAIGVVRLHF